MKQKTINILGTEYSISIDDSLNNSNMDGVCKEYDKEIRVRDYKSMLCDDDLEITKMKRFKEVLRHEMIHAFFYEAGLSEYSNNEQLVDWIAIQFPKIKKAFEEADCL